MKNPNDDQIGGGHYKSKAVQPWDYIVGNNIPYLEGNIIKYISRWRDKGGLNDLEKARHYLDKLIFVEEAKQKDGYYDEYAKQNRARSSDPIGAVGAGAYSFDGTNKRRD